MIDEYNQKNNEYFKIPKCKSEHENYCLIRTDKE